MKKYIVFFLANFNLINITCGQSVGIGTTTPNVTARLHVALAGSTTDGLLVTGNNSAVAGTVPDLGAGTRLMFYPSKGAFRAGGVDGTQWNNVNVGAYSNAIGWNTIASGQYSTSIGDQSWATNYASEAFGHGCLSTGVGAVALGYLSTATGDFSTVGGRISTASGYASFAVGFKDTARADYSFASGQFCSANGINSTAMGIYNIAGGNNSVALGDQNTASGSGSVAFGTICQAQGNRSVAMGYATYATGDNSTATGFSTRANANYSTAMGNYITIRNVDTGSFAIGDFTNVANLMTPRKDVMLMRFSGGYNFYTNAIATVGVQLGIGANSWSVLSDRRRKENLVTADGEGFLQKINDFELGSWNYKGQDPTIFRHYGPMAQDFYAAFGKDEFGEIGNDTTIASADFDGVNMIAIQALIKRTVQLKAGNEKSLQLNLAQQKEIDQLKSENEKLKSEMALMQKDKTDLAARIEKIELVLNIGKQKDNLAVSK